jgi:hypothetical protein
LPSVNPVAFSGPRIFVRQGDAEFCLAGASAAAARVIDSLEILAGILHPNEFPDFANNSSVDRVTKLKVSRIVA